MTDTLSFPGLGLEFNINRIAFNITENWAIHWYGVIIAVAFLSATMYIFRRVKDFGLDSDRVIDVLLGGVLGGIVGARLYYVAFTWGDTYRNNPLSIFNIRLGGIAIYGGIIGGVLVGIILCKIRRVKLLPMLDVAAGGLLLGQAIGRWGNFVNMEAFGGNTTLPWGMTSNTIQNYLSYHQAELAAIGVQVDPTMPVHPTFLYESLWCLLGFFFICWFTNRRRYDGELSLIYIGWYGIGRFVIEGLRTDSLMLGTMRVSQVLALLCVAVSVAIMLVIRSRIRRAGDPDYLKIYVDTEEGQSVLAGTFYKKREEAKNVDAPPAVEESPDAADSAASDDAAAAESLGEEEEHFPENVEEPDPPEALPEQSSQSSATQAPSNQEPESEPLAEEGGSEA